MVIISLFIELSFSQSKIYFFRVTSCCCTFVYHVIAERKALWEMKKRKNLAPALKWEVLRAAKACCNIIKRCSLCLHEKLAIITYPYPDELLNRRSELITKCKHENKFLLKNFNSYDWSFEPSDNVRKYDINDIPNGFILLAFSAWVIRLEQSKNISKLIWGCLCFAFVDSFRCWMSIRWIYLEYRL